MNLLSLFIFFFICCFSASAEESLCPTIIIDADEKLDFTSTEIRLMCGDKEVKAYHHIPPYQAAFLLQGFLQARGYLAPEFKNVDGVLHVKAGDKSQLSSIKIHANGLSDLSRLRETTQRLYLGKSLNPNLLDSIEAQSKTILRESGKPCSEVKTIANISDGEVEIFLTKTQVHTFGNFEKEKIEGLHRNALERYYPFKSNYIFDERLLKLNEKRMLRAEVVQGTYFLEKCEKNGESFSMEQNFLLSPPRTFRFGIGASTELGPMARVVWSHNRFGPMASILSGKIIGSFRTQSLSLMADSFLWNESSRRSLLSELNITRESQIDYEQLLVKLTPGSFKWTRDFYGRGSTLMLGPSLESGTFHTKETSTRTYNSAVLEASYNLMSHRYELFDIFPEEGDVLSFKTSYRDPSLGFSDVALKLEGSYAKLATIGQMGRGRIIGGFRLNAGTLFIDDDVPIGPLPPAVKFYGGGSDDLRGFTLNTLPNNDGIGALTLTTLKLEGRNTYFFHQKVENFIFIDGGYFGYKTLSTTSNLLYSPGFGIRWKSPIGVVQGYWARALSLSPSEDLGNMFYAGLGGSF